VQAPAAGHEVVLKGFHHRVFSRPDARAAADAMPRLSLHEQGQGQFQVDFGYTISQGIIQAQKAIKAPGSGVAVRRQMSD